MTQCLYERQRKVFKVVLNQTASVMSVVLDIYVCMIDKLFIYQISNETLMKPSNEFIIIMLDI